jgi:signal transduction histidine kinase
MGELGMLYATQEFSEYNPITAREYLSEAIASLDNSFLKDKLDFCKKLRSVLENLGEWQEALYYYKLSDQCRDQMQLDEIKKQAGLYAFEQQIEAAYKEAQLLTEKNIALEQANKIKMHLFSIVSHDLKNPLDVNQVIIERLKQKLSHIDADSDKLLDRLQSNTQQMLDHIVHFSDQARELATMQLCKEKCDVRVPVMNAVSNNQIVAHNKQQTITMELDEITDTIDEMKFMQVMDNLLSNAIKYSPTNTTISVELQHHYASSYRVIVTDQGQGMSAEDISKLFTFGERLSSIPTGGETSHGIGLSVVQEIITLHGGKVWAESEGKGKGTKFMIEMQLHN